MADRTARISAETYIEEPGDLWTAAIPVSRHAELPQLIKQGRSHLWSWPDGRLLSLGEAPRTSFEGTTRQQLTKFLERSRLGGAVLLPSAAQRLYGELGHEQASPGFLEECLDAYNYWALGLANTDPERLRALALVDVADPARTVEAMRYWAGAGAAGFVLPCAPGGERRYDDGEFEVIWRTAHELGLPLVLLAGANPAAPAEEQAERVREPRTMAARLAQRATSVFPARRSVTAITFTGVFERYPGLRIGTAGFGASWRAFAMVRADEMYEVRPERTGPPTRVPPQFAGAVEEAAREEAVDSSQRSGTRGMAPEGVGFHFADGETFSSHVRDHVFSTFTTDDDLAVSMRDYLSIRGLMWGTGRPVRGFGRTRLGSASGGVTTVNGLFRGLARDEVTSMTSTNACEVFGFPA